MRMLPTTFFLSLSPLFPLSLLPVPTHTLSIPPTPSWPAGRCTDKSLTIPSWIISDFKIVKGIANFKADNRASPVTGWVDYNCTGTAERKECVGSAATGEMRASWSRNADGTSVVEMLGFWVCGDEGDRVKFTAKGNTTITECKGQDCVSPITYLVPGTLSLPVPLTPVQPKPPPGFDKETCAEVGEKQWTVTGVSYENYTKGQCRQWYNPDVICIDPVDFIDKGEYLSLNVINNAISHQVRCSFTPEYLKTSLPRPLRCTGGQFNEITLDVTFSGNAPDFTVKVEEVWYCLENPKVNTKPSAILASGTTILTLSCSTQTGITNTTDDIITICTDNANSSHSINGNQLEKQTLPPYSLVTAWPVHGGCTFDSVVNPTWFYRGMAFKTNSFPPENPNSAELTQFSAGLTGPGFKDFWFYGNYRINGSGVDRLYSCNSYYDGKPRDQHWNCTFSFNPHTKSITQEKVWECRDKNPRQPLYFTGSGTFDWTQAPIYTCNTPSNSIQCYWRGDTAVLQPGVPYDVPKVVASLVNVPPVEYPSTNTRQGIKAAVQVGNGEWEKDTVRVGGEWMMIGEV